MQNAKLSDNKPEPGNVAKAQSYGQPGKFEAAEETGEEAGEETREQSGEETTEGRRVLAFAGEIDTDNSELKPEVPGGGFWADILVLLKDDVPVYALLSDSSSVQAELRDNLLIIKAGNPFTVSTIESKMFSDPLKEAALKVLGREVILRVETGGGTASEGKQDKLERLSTFDIIEFE